MFTIKGKFTEALVTIDDVEAECRRQIHAFTNHPAFTEKIVMMPDTHAGAGVPIGFCMPITKRVIPNVIGVDIGCGMLAHEMDFDFSRFSQDDWDKFDPQIRRDVPTGFNIHRKELIDLRDAGEFWLAINQEAQGFIQAWNEKFGTDHKIPILDWHWLKTLVRQAGTSREKASLSLGTLGGGNHFIEIGRSEETGKYWLTIHSGSRNFGLRVANHHQKVARNDLLKRRQGFEAEQIQQILADPTNLEYRQELLQNAKSQAGLGEDIQLRNLEWLEGEHAIDYLLAMIFAQKFASLNRELMADQIFNSMAHRRGVRRKDLVSGRKIESIHNFIDFRDMTVRKGAIRSYKGEEMVIPFNMRDGLLICEGKSNAEWNNTAPHGAGRVMSRTKAKQTLSMEDFKEGMKDIHTNSVCAATIDESHMAYKDSEMIENAIGPTCTVLEHVPPVFNLKDKEDKKRKKK